MAAVRTYKVSLREATREVKPYGAFFSTSFMWDEQPPVQTTLQAETLDELSGRIRDLFVESTDWQYAFVYVRVADGQRKPNGFARRFETNNGAVIAREQAAV